MGAGEGLPCSWQKKKVKKKISSKLLQHCQGALLTLIIYIGNTATSKKVVEL